MEVKVFNRAGRELAVLTLGEEASVFALKREFHRKCTLHPDPKWYPARQWLTVGSAHGSPLKDDSAKLQPLLKGLNTVYFKDLGPQVSYRLVYMLEYLGPMLLHPAFYNFPKLFYRLALPHSTVQKVAAFMITGHFIKRELESMFLHRFSSATMPVAKLPINSTYYWILNGVLLGYSLFSPKFSSPKYSSTGHSIAIGLFILFEFLNFHAHLILRNLRPEGSKVRGIPKGQGFSLVSCANYLWEICAWTVVAVYTRSKASYLFLACSTAILMKWASERHLKYKKEFDGKEGREMYPKRRKALIPFIF